MWHSFCLEAVIVSFLSWEVCNVLYGKPGVLSHWADMPKGHSTNGGGDCLHIGDPGDLILYNTASTHCSHCRFDDHFWLCELQGHLKSGHRQQVPLQAGCYLLKAQGWSYHVCWFQRLGWGQISFSQLYLQLLFCPLALSSPHLRALVAVPSFCIPKGWWGLSHCHDQPRGVQQLLPTGESVWWSLHPHLLLLWHLGWGRFLEGLYDRCGYLFRWNISRGLTSEEPLL